MTSVADNQNVDEFANNSCTAFTRALRQTRLQFFVEPATDANQGVVDDTVCTFLKSMNSECVARPPTVLDTRSNAFCTFVRRARPECDDSLANSTNASATQDYKIQLDECEKMLTALSTGSCYYPGSRPCNTEFMLDIILIIDYGDAILEAVSLFFAILIMIGGIAVQPSDDVPFVACFWKGIPVERIILLVLMVLDIVSCLVTTTLAAWTITPVRSMLDLGCVNRLSPSFLALNGSAEETLHFAIFLGVLEACIATFTFLETMHAWLTEDCFVETVDLPKRITIGYSETDSINISTQWCAQKNPIDNNPPGRCECLRLPRKLFREKLYDKTRCGYWKRKEGYQSIIESLQNNYLLERQLVEAKEVKNDEKAKCQDALLTIILLLIDTVITLAELVILMNSREETVGIFNGATDGSKLDWCYFCEPKNGIQKHRVASRREWMNNFFTTTQVIIICSVIGALVLVSIILTILARCLADGIRGQWFRGYM